MRCDQCKFWVSIAVATADDPTEVPNGWCKRHAPIPVMPRYVLPAVWETNKTLMDSQAQTAQWPETEPEDWCGEHQPKKPPDKTRPPRDLSLSVKKFPFSIIANNTLKKCGVATLADMQNVTLSQICSFKALNESTLIEIRDFCRMFGINLR